MAKKNTKLSYRSAVKEIEDTLMLLENADLDMDDLSEKVKRVAELIAYCKKSLHHTEKEVHALLDELNSDHAIDKNGDDDVTSD